MWVPTRARGRSWAETDAIRLIGPIEITRKRKERERKIRECRSTIHALSASTRRARQGLAMHLVSYLHDHRALPSIAPALARDATTRRREKEDRRERERQISVTDFLKSRLVSPRRGEIANSGSWSSNPIDVFWQPRYALLFLKVYRRDCR